MVLLPMAPVLPSQSHSPSRCSSPLPTTAAARSRGSHSAPVSRRPSFSTIDYRSIALQQRRRSLPRTLAAIESTRAFKNAIAHAAHKPTPPPSLNTTSISQQGQPLHELSTPSFRQLQSSDVPTRRRIVVPPSLLRQNQPQPSPRIVDDGVDAFLTSFQPPKPPPPRTLVPSLRERLDALDASESGGDKEPPASGQKGAALKLRAGLTPRFTPRPSELDKATMEAAAARERANAAAEVAAQAMEDAEAKTSRARSVLDIDPASLDALEAWSVRKAPREAERATRWAEEARVAADALHTDARVASISALAHSENDDVRALCGTEAVLTLTTIARFVKDERCDLRDHAAVIGKSIHHNLAGSLPLSPFRWSKHGGGPLPPPPSLAQPRKGTPRGSCRSPKWR